MKKIRNIVLLAGFTLAFNYSFGQSAELIKQSNDETEMLTQKLDLTPDQNERVGGIIYGIIMKNEGIRTSDFSNEEKERIYASNAQAKDEMLKNILTEEQFKEYLKLKK